MRSRRWLLPWLLAAAATIGVATVALADAIPSPPRDCVDGSHGSSSHAGRYCVPNATCRSDASCRGNAGLGLGTACRPTALCIARVHVNVGGRMPQRVNIQKVVGTCDANGGCEAGAQCVRAQRCASPTAAPGPAASS